MKKYMEISQSEFKRHLEDYLSHAEYYSCVVLYRSSESLGWYAGLRIGELMYEYFKRRMDQQINILLTLELRKIISDLTEMGENDVLLLDIDNRYIEPLCPQLVSEVLTNKKSIIFISKDDNPLIRGFKDIIDVLIQVNSTDRGMLNCVIDIHERGKRDLKLSLPDRSLIDKYNDLRASLLKEAIRKQVPELDDRE